MTVKGLLAGLDSKELSEWQAYFALEKENTNKDIKPPLENQIKFGMGGYNKHKLRRHG